MYVMGMPHVMCMMKVMCMPTLGRDRNRNGKTQD
jgi:hypothetical protein